MASTPSRLLEIIGKVRLHSDFAAKAADGSTWTDVHLSGPMLLGGAPFAEVLLLGDYQSLSSSGCEFLPLFVTAGSNVANRSDVFVAFAP